VGSGSGLAEETKEEHAGEIDADVEGELAVLGSAGAGAAELGEDGAEVHGAVDDVAIEPAQGRGDAAQDDAADEEQPDLVDIELVLDDAVPGGAVGAVEGAGEVGGARGRR